MVKEFPLFPLLAAADLIVCVLSNIIVTAAMLGTPTLVCDFINRRQVLDFVLEGLAFGCFDSRLVNAEVRRILFDSAVRTNWLQEKERALTRFNGPCDGNSARRIADFMLPSTRANI